MLVDLRIKNYALISELEVNFQEGLNILTGETGAGKSIIIGALEILLGARASGDLIRTGCQSAYIEAVFQPAQLSEINQRLEEMGIETDESQLLISRELRVNGPTKSRINGQLATAAMIREVSGSLVDIHGQHEHQYLLDSGLHRKILDDFSGMKNAGLQSAVAAVYREIQGLKKELVEVALSDGEKARQIDLLEFQIEEIERARLKENELEELHREYNIMSNMEEIYSITGGVYSEINGEDYSQSGLLERTGALMKQLETIKDFDPELEKLAGDMRDIYYRLEGLGFELNDYHQGLEFDQQKLNRLEERLNLLNGLQRKYGESIEEILAFKDQLEGKLKRIKDQEKMAAELNKRLLVRQEEYSKEAGELSRLRKKMARGLKERVQQELEDLAMKNTRFEVSIDEKPPAADGIDRVEFLISPNPGEELKPLARIASGGELSRIMLALKTIIARIDQVETLIFDEVDSGVGGKTAQLMAEKLAIIARQRQVICITHLPQIASMADYHYFIAKEAGEKHALTTISLLDEMGQREELARMLGGVKLTRTTLEHAGEMIELAGEKKASL